MKDSINRKAQQRSVMAAPSDDRNGVVVNRARGASRGSTCDRLNNRHGELSGRREVRFASSEIHAKNEAHGAVLVKLSKVGVNLGVF